MNHSWTLDANTSRRRNCHVVYFEYCLDFRISPSRMRSWKILGKWSRVPELLHSRIPSLFSPPSLSATPKKSLSFGQNIVTPARKVSYPIGWSVKKWFSQNFFASERTHSDFLIWNMIMLLSIEAQIFLWIIRLQGRAQIVDNQFKSNQRILKINQIKSNHALRRSVQIKSSFHFISNKFKS